MASAAAVQQVAAKNQALRLEITRVIRAPRAKVFEAFIRPETIRQWFGPPNWTCPEAQVDAVVNGQYSIAMEGPSPDGVLRSTRVTGSYLKVNPFDLLQFTWDAGWAPDETSIVTLHFRDVEGGTELKLVHDRFATETSRDAHNHGWTGSLDKFVALLES